MVKRILCLLVACLGVAVIIGPTPVEAGARKELAFAVSLAQKGLWREAAFRFEALARKNPNNPRLWNNVAVAYEASGLYDKAHEAYERAVRVRIPRLTAMDQNREAFEAFYTTWKASQSPAPTSPSNGTDASGVPSNDGGSQGGIQVENRR